MSGREVQITLTEGSETGSLSGQFGFMQNPFSNQTMNLLSIEYFPECLTVDETDGSAIEASDRNDINYELKIVSDGDELTAEDLTERFGYEES